MGQMLELGARVIDLDTGEVIGVGTLRPIERALLSYLAEHADRMVSIEELHAQVWGYAPAVRSRAAYATINRLRAVIEPDPGCPRFLVAQRSAGYQLKGGQLRPREPAALLGSLPAERDGFVGRQRDLQALRERLGAGARLVTITGTGGFGKTRLAVHFAWLERELWPGGVWFCDLSGARSLEGLLWAVAGTFGISLQGEPVQRLGSLLAARGRCLVILDNFEQVALHAEATLGRWLERAPLAAFLVTSRERLGLAGEHLEPLGPLEPADGRDLFVARARAVRREYEPDPAELALIDELVQKLDHLPLAIELAAGRLRSRSVSELLVRLSDRKALLDAGGRRLDRHATLWAALDTSWELLDEPLQAALARLAVFVGLFDEAAALHVLQGPAELLDRLVDRSLVQPAAPGRFRLLLSVRDYALEKLEARGEREQAERRHGEWFVQFGTEQAILDLYLQRAPAPELDEADLLVACQRAVARGDGAVAVPVLRALRRVQEGRGPAEAHVLVEGVLALPHLTPTELALTHQLAGSISLQLGRSPVAIEHLRVATALCREIGYARLLGAAHNALGAVHALQGRLPEARAEFLAALEAYRDLPDRELLSAPTRLNLALEFLHADPATCARQIEEILPQIRQLGPADEARALTNLAMAYQDTGQPELAYEMLQEALASLHRLGQRQTEAIVMGNLGVVLDTLDRLEEAVAITQQGLELYHRLGCSADEARLWRQLAKLARRQGDLVQARACLERSLALERELGNTALEQQVLEALSLLTD